MMFNKSLTAKSTWTLIRLLGCDSVMAFQNIGLNQCDQMVRLVFNI